VSADPKATVSWIAGAFYSDERKHEASRVISARGEVDSWNATSIDQTRLEGFGQMSIRLTHRLTASAAARIGRSRYGAFTAVPPICRAEGTETGVAPGYGLSYQPEEPRLFYVTLAKGYRGPEVSPATPCSDAVVDPADAVWSLEVGTKNTLLDG